MSANLVLREVDAEKMPEASFELSDQHRFYWVFGGCEGQSTHNLHRCRPVPINGRAGLGLDADGWLGDAHWEGGHFGGGRGVVYRVTCPTELFPKAHARSDESHAARHTDAFPLKES